MDSSVLVLIIALIFPSVSNSTDEHVPSDILSLGTEHDIHRNLSTCRKLCLEIVKNAIEVKACGEDRETARAIVWLECPKDLISNMKADEDQASQTSISDRILLVPVSKNNDIPIYGYIPHNSSIFTFPKLESLRFISSICYLSAERKLYVTSSWESILCYYPDMKWKRQCLKSEYKTEAVTSDNVNHLLFLAVTYPHAKTCIIQLSPGGNQSTVFCWTRPVLIRSLSLDTASKIIYVGSQTDIYSITYHGKFLKKLVHANFIMRMTYSMTYNKLYHTVGKRLIVSSVSPYQQTFHFDFTRTPWDILVHDGKLFATFIGSRELFVGDVLELSKNLKIGLKHMSVKRLLCLIHE